MTMTMTSRSLLKTRSLALRASILAALGLAGCTDGKGDDDGSAGSASSTGSSESTGATAGSTDATAGTTSATDGTTSATDGMTGGMTGSSGTSTTTTGTSTTDGTTDGTTGMVVPLCDDPQPIMQEFVDPPTPSGFELCADGTIHRAAPTECAAPATPSSCMDSRNGGCKTDADCTEFPFGSCQQDMAFGGVVELGGSCSCVYGCATDADCDAGQICRCAGPGLGLYTECIAANCVESGECGDYLCALSPDTCEPGGFLTQCHGPGDLCYGSDECGSTDCIYADYMMPPAWACNDAVCGRPFLIDDAARTAPVIAGEGWAAAGIGPDASRLSAGQRERLAAHWSAIAAMEHASVASFARFILDLMAVAAPAELVTLAQAALADEIDHARRTFALASAYAGHALGAGPLAIDGALASAGDRVALAIAVAREACVAETLAAFEARAAADAARDPVVRRTLAAIADDEDRHARLGWQVLGWLLGQVDEDGRAAVLIALDRAIAEARVGDGRISDESPEDLEALRDHGVLAQASRAQVVRCALEEIVQPCARALAVAHAA